MSAKRKTKPKTKPKQSSRHLAVVQPPRPPQQASHYGSQIQAAIERGYSPDVVQRMLEIEKSLHAEQSRRMFEAALANAKAELPAIIKNREVDFTSSKGRTRYRYEDLPAVMAAVDPVLSRHGLAVRFRTEQLTADSVKVTCVLFGHGHSEENSLQGQVDLSGNKNNIQAIGSTTTYLQRYTLKAALGLAASHDNDGRKEVEYISDEQKTVLNKLLAETAASPDNFLKWAGVASLDELSTERYTEAVAQLELKRHRSAS
jgi:hypothetical protein